MAGLNLDFLDPSKNPNLFRKLAAGGLSGALTLAAGGRGDQALGTALDTTSEIANQDVDMGLRRAKEMGEQQDRAIRSRQVAVQESENYRSQKLFQEGSRDKAVQNLAQRIPNFERLPADQREQLIMEESRAIQTGQGNVNATEYEKTHPILEKAPIIGGLFRGVQPALDPETKMALDERNKKINQGLYGQKLNATEFKKLKDNEKALEQELRKKNARKTTVSKRS